MHSHPPSNNKEVASKLKVEMYTTRKECFLTLDGYTMKIATALSTTVQQDVIKSTTERAANIRAVLSTLKPSFVTATLVVNKIPLRAAEYCVFQQ